MKAALKPQDWLLKNIRQFDYYIYQIECMKNGRKYIGRTHNRPDYRIQKHFEKLRANRHSNADLQNDFNLYGEACFRIKWLCATNDKNAEKEWMIKLRTYDREYGYNSVDPFFRKRQKEEMP